MRSMTSTWIGAVVLTAAVLAIIPTAAAPQWIEAAARQVIGNVVQEGIEDAMEDAALDTALDAAITHTVGSAARDGIGAAMQAAEVADTLDDVMDAAEAARTIRRIFR